MLVFGTRPEAIKMAPLVKEFQKAPDSFKTIVCVTGQHREMLDQVLRIFEIIPDYDLNIKSGTVHLVGTDHDLIVSEVSTLLDDVQVYERMSKAVNPYGDGKACSRIVRALRGEAVERYGA